MPCTHVGVRPLLSGIDMVAERIRSRRLKVSAECSELIRESGLYSYDPAKDREQPIDADNHALDALRYLIVMIDRGRAIHHQKPNLPEDDAASLGRIVERMRARPPIEPEPEPPEPEPEWPEPWWLRHSPDDE